MRSLPAQRDQFRVGSAGVQPRLRLGQITGCRVLHCLQRRLAAKRWLAGEDYAQDAAQDKHVGEVIDRLGAGLLGVHVRRRVQHRPRLGLVVGRFADGAIVGGQVASAPTVGSVRVADARGWSTASRLVRSLARLKAVVEHVRRWLFPIKQHKERRRKSRE